VQAISRIFSASKQHGDEDESDSLSEVFFEGCFRQEMLNFTADFLDGTKRSDLAAKTARDA